MCLFRTLFARLRTKSRQIAGLLMPICPYAGIAPHYERANRSGRAYTVIGSKTLVNLRSTRRTVPSSSTCT